MIDPQTVDWDDVSPRVYAGAVHVFKITESLAKTASFVKGQQIKDYVQETILRFCEHPEKFRGDSIELLVKYLVLNILRSLRSKDMRLVENEITVAIGDQRLESSEDNESAFLAEALLFVDAHFEAETDYNSIMMRIEDLTKGNSILREIFDGISCGIPPCEIRIALDISEKEYNNAKRRLTTLLKHLKKEFNLKREELYE